MHFVFSGKKMNGQIRTPLYNAVHCLGRYLKPIILLIIIIASLL